MTSRKQIHIAVWLIGLALLAWLQWWPILIALAIISLLMEIDARRQRTHLQGTSSANISAGAVTVSGSVTIKGDVVGRHKIVSEGGADTPQLDQLAEADTREDVIIEGEGVFVGGDVVGGDLIRNSVKPSAAPADWLPSKCPNCSGPLSVSTVKWTGATSAECLYCGSTLKATRPPEGP